MCDIPFFTTDYLFYACPIARQCGQLFFRSSEDLLHCVASSLSVPGGHCKGLLDPSRGSRDNRERMQRRDFVQHCSPVRPLHID